MTRETIRKQITERLRGRTSRHGLIEMIDSGEVVDLDYSETMEYAREGGAVAEIVEEMASAGIVTLAEIPRWWPGRMKRLRDVLSNAQNKGVEIKDNPPTVWMQDRVGNRVCCTISDATQKAVTAAIREARKDLKSRTSRTKRYLAAERSVNES